MIFDPSYGDEGPPRMIDSIDELGAAVLAGQRPWRLAWGASMITVLCALTHAGVAFTAVGAACTLVITVCALIDERAEQ